MTYTIPAPDAADFNFAAEGYTIPAADAVDFNLAELGGGGGVYTIVPGVIASVGTVWRKRPARKQHVVASGFGDAPERTIRRALNAADAERIHYNPTVSGFGDAPERSIARSLAHEDSNPRDTCRSSPHGNARQLDGASRLSQWANASITLDPPWFMMHEDGTPRDIQPTQRWWETDVYRQGVPGEVVFWRRQGAYISPAAVTANLHVVLPPTTPWPDFRIIDGETTLEARISPSDPYVRTRHGVAEHRDVDPALPWGPGGRRDTTLDFEYPAEGDTVPAPGDTFLIPVRRLYVVSNSAQIVRVSDGRDIPAQSVQLSTSIGNFGWSMSASLSGRDTLALVEGTDGEPIEVDVTINSTTWRIIVDGWSLSEASTGRRGTIRGRSRSAYLAAPYASPGDHEQTSSILVQQAAADALPPGWNLSWSAADWIIPANVFKYQGQTPIEVVNRLAEAGGAYVQTDREGDILLVKQRYPLAPWLWHLRSPDYEIPRDVIVQRGSTKKPGQGRNAIYIHGGRTNGILARVLRQGTAGDNLLPTLVDDLITDTVPARHRGIAELAAQMRLSQEQHELPLSVSLGGLMLPGSFVAVGDAPGGVFSQDWIGLVNGTTVSAQAQRAGDRGVNLKVRQLLEIERHFED
jgi:hypothetical protein